MSVAWKVISASDLNDYQVGAMMDALRSAALADGQADPFENVMHDRCNYIRNRISKKIQISSTAYAVPPELKTCACWLIIEAMQTRLPGLSLSEDQKSQIRQAYKDLDIAATDDFPVSSPTDPETPTVSSSASGKVIQKPSASFTRSSMAGL